MKAQAISKFIRLMVIGSIIVMINSSQLIAQYTPLQKVGGDPSLIIQYDNQQLQRLGIGPDFTNSIYVPRARFHQREIKSSTEISKFEITDQDGVSLCDMRFLFDVNNVKYNLYQTGINFQSYFEGPLGSSSSLFLDGEDIAINTFQAITLPIAMRASPSGPVSTPLTIFRLQKVEVRDTLDCNNFRMNYSAGLNKIMISDELGNGTWFDPSGLNDHKWLINSHGDLYSSPDRNHVGIGFQDRDEKFYQKLHVVDGNILISRLNGGNPCSFNGSLLFGDNQVNDDYPNGQWGIEYYNEGLNFWKVYDRTLENPDISEEDGYNYRLFLKDDGSVGIGCENTHGYKLAVYGNILCEEVLVRTHPNWPDFVFDQDYKLLPLNELESYTKINKHLPEMPTAQEVEKNGVNLGNVSAALLKKVEELTRYIIAQQKEIDYLKAAVRKN